MTWADNNYEHRKKITISGALVSGSHTHFPILVNITDSELNTCRSDGYDIIFYDSSNTVKLAHELELFSSNTTTKLITWVDGLLVSGANSNSNQAAPESHPSSTLWMYYEYASATDTSDTTDVWDDNFIGVFHMNDASTTTVTDSTGTHNGTKGSANNPKGISYGYIGSGQLYDTNTDHIECANTFVWPDNFTVSLWIYRQHSDSDPAYLLNWEKTGDANNKIAMLWQPTTDNRINCYTRDAGTYTRATCADSYLPANTWTYMTWYGKQGSPMELYFNGVEASYDEYQDNPGSYTNVGTMWIGNERTEDDSCFGRYDEVRLSNTNRSQEWIWTNYKTQSDSNFLRFGSEEDKPVTPSVSSVELYQNTNNYGNNELYLDVGNWIA